MKKMIWLVMFLVLITSNAFAVGTITQTLQEPSKGYGPLEWVRVLTYTCTADAAAGTFPSAPILTPPFPISNLSQIPSFSSTST